MQVTEDPEIMAFWEELQTKGHPDKKEGWPKLTDIKSLRDILVSIAFNGSVHHSAVNFGEFFHSYRSLQTSIMRKDTFPSVILTWMRDSIELFSDLLWVWSM